VLEVREMFRKLLPFLMVAVALSTAFAVLFATQRMGLTPPSLDRLVKRADLEPDLPDAEA
jgi:hypothetical protein